MGFLFYLVFFLMRLAFLFVPDHDSICMKREDAKEERRMTKR
jgi:hypothetical protein